MKNILKSYFLGFGSCFFFWKRLDTGLVWVDQERYSCEGEE